MIEVTSILVRSFDLDHLDIFWELGTQDAERIDEFDFFLLRSIDGAGGPFEVIAGPFFNTYQCRDPNVHQLHKWRKYYYKVRVTHRETQESREFGPEYLRAPPDRIALEIQRREALLWKEHAGRLVVFYPKLTFGQRCKHCWDRGRRGNTIGRSVQQNCNTCYDTTYVGGFANPIGVFMQIDPAPERAQKSDTKEHQPITTTARTVAFPPIKSKDMVVEAENKRWVVDKVSYTEKRRAVIRQELQMTQYPKDDIKYSVPVNMDLKAQHAAPRAFTRPMSTQSTYDKALEELVG